MEEQQPWHRLFGLSWMDFFRGMPVTVTMERDLSVKKQLLDVAIIHKEPGPLHCRLPDGFEVLAPFNLVTFKSLQGRLSAFTLEELLGHYVNLRKQESPSMDERDLLAPDDFRLFAVCARYPEKLAEENLLLRPVKPGVYEVDALSRCIRVVVAGQLPPEEHNALLHLFSANRELIRYGAAHYRIRSEETSFLFGDLLDKYNREGLNMADLLEEFTRRRIDELLKNLPVEKRLEGLSTEERLEGLPVEEFLKRLPAEELLKRLPLEERLKGASEEELLAALRRLKANGQSAG